MNKKLSFLLLIGLLTLICACQRKQFPYGGDTNTAGNPEYNLEVDVNKPVAGK